MPGLLGERRKREEDSSATKKPCLERKREKMPLVQKACVREREVRCARIRKAVCVSVRERRTEYCTRCPRNVFVPRCPTYKHFFNQGEILNVYLPTLEGSKKDTVYANTNVSIWYPLLTKMADIRKSHF